MSKFYFTRKNLIEISLVFSFFAFFLFVFACVDADHSIMAKDNPVEMLYLAIGLPAVKAGFSGYATSILIVVFMTLADAGVIFIRRLAKFKKEKFMTFKWVALSTLFVLICVALSFGTGLTYLAIAANSPIPLLSLLVSSLLVAFILYIFLAALAFAGLSIYVNFKHIDKPYRFFNVAEQEQYEQELDEEEEKSQENQDNLAAKFGENIDADALALGAGALGAVGGGSGQDVGKLSDREKVFAGLSSIDIEFEGFESEKRPVTNIGLDKLCSDFRLYLAAEEKLYFDINTIRAFISGFAASRIIILEGLSGTGKSSLPRYFAKFINAKANFNPVQTTWRDKTSLVGYFNDFTQTFNETEFLKQLYRSTYEKDLFNMMVLDEFNIARVEYYFADFLSILEYPIEEQLIKVMQLPFDFVPPTHLQKGVLKIQPNTYFVCTANKDDSTFSISDKVYDRAIIIDFDDKNIPFEAKANVKRIPIGFDELNKLYLAAKDNKEYLLTHEDILKFSLITDYVYENLDVTFGNRIMHQIEQFVPVFIACGGKKEEALDFLFARKVLTKVQGRYEDYVKTSLLNLDKLITKQYGNKSFSISKQLIASIIRRL